jgi:uncharacterized membrane protein YkvA (DUF1232 family)
MSRTSFRPDWRGIIRYLRSPSTDWKPKLLLAVAVLYLVWPFDLLPDLAPILGWLDDLGLGMIAAWLVVRAASALPPEK